MKNLKQILLAGSILLTACGPKTLTKEDFERTKWIEAPYTKQIWTGYTGEQIEPARDKNWQIYMEEVAKRNDGLKYKITQNGIIQIVYNGETIFLPDLDGNGLVQYKSNSYFAATDKIKPAKTSETKNEGNH